jgi:flagellar biosynthesis/type III secretory pathway protein FliH
MPEHGSAREFQIVFRSWPRLGAVARASPLLPLPSVPLAKVPQPDPARQEREERQAIEQVLDHLRTTAAHYAEHYESMIEEMRHAAIELAIAVAGRVVFDKLDSNEFPIEEMVGQAVARLPAAPSLSVYLHPDDLALLQRRLAGKPVLLPSEAKIRIEADSSLRRGGCRAEASEIHVLADLADQLAGLRQHLLWSSSHAQSEPGETAP